ncbi:hypothetical protein HDEF_0247 [Candidatus Hamiltonella defensa 5AT (Acyrthosiphon pisum)]|uniref:Uncharacterized protein n=1 Tax=Hamiltonella defensa subsp. Acyrthosiphon pisum (strain 5AT) TaxID=572265 RepID=C4K372_HAMD5|nr:hypothetical protein HDEF_0247 [Candidatus Hamiltonella defensa 5AT (Acyrthosiphon pisum)]
MLFVNEVEGVLEKVFVTFLFFITALSAFSVVTLDVFA